MVDPNAPNPNEQSQQPGTTSAPGELPVVLPPALKGSEEILKARLDYAWKFFSYHADQRIKMFNFILVVLGVLAGAVLTAFDKKFYVPALAISVIAFLIAIVFRWLDRRNELFVHIGEDVLGHLESDWLFSEPKQINSQRLDDRPIIPHGLLTRHWLEDRSGTNWFGQLTAGRHRVCLRFIELLLAIMFAAAAGYSIYEICCGQTQVNLQISGSSSSSVSANGISLQASASASGTGSLSFVVTSVGAVPSSSPSGTGPQPPITPIATSSIPQSPIATATVPQSPSLSAATGTTTPSVPTATKSPPAIIPSATSTIQPVPASTATGS